jgi:electron transfer flavoprotein alpha subunit
MAGNEGVLICGEAVEAKITTMTRELISAGRRLSDDLGQPLSLLLIGQNTGEAADEAVSLGADRVYLAGGETFAESQPERYSAIITGVCRQTAPSIVLLGHTDMGRDTAPRIAASLEAPACLDCVDLAIDPDDKSLLQTKPVYGGNATAVWASMGDKIRVVTMRPRASEPAEPDGLKKGEILPVTVDLDEAEISGKLLKTVKEEVKGIRLEEARVVVSGGGGIGGSEGFRLLQQLAQTLGGAVGTSRVPRDEGWMPGGIEIGQTGHIVSPDLYIAVGISGAPQHMAGCSGSKCIVAINRDPEAHIFKVADFGIVADYREAVPALTEKCRAILT